MDEPNKQTEDSVSSVLDQENQAAKVAVDGARLQELAQNKPAASQAANPYYDQQVQPGQVVGYNIPTNQKVEIPIVKKPRFSGPSKKFLRTLIAFFATLVVLTILAALIYLGRNSISF